MVAKAPVEGEVKTRLSPALTPRQATSVARALLRDTLANAGRVGADRWCVYAGCRATVQGAIPVGVALLEQAGETFALRLAAAQAGLFARGYDRVVLLGADCPTVGPADLRHALQALEVADVVLGPARDGGYTMLGARAPEPALFAGVPMGTGTVLAATIARVRRAGLTVALTRPRHDLDTVEDLLAAWAAGELRDAPTTTAVLTALGSGQGPGRGEGEADQAVLTAGHLRADLGGDGLLG